VYPLHPLSVHFPIALLLANGLLTLLYLRGWGAAFETSAYHCLVLGWLGTGVALVTGTIDAARQLPLGPALGWVNAHAAVGIAILIVYGQALLQRRRDPHLLKPDAVGRRAYLTRLALGAGLVVLDGWLGGHLVYGIGLGIGL
jgi:uncharacterized membrane protein